MRGRWETKRPWTKGATRTTTRNPREGRGEIKPSGLSEGPGPGRNGTGRSLKKGDDETHGVEISIARKIEDAEHGFYPAVFFFFFLSHNIHCSYGRRIRMQQKAMA